MRLTKYEKETIILTSEGDDTYSVYTFNAALKRRLADFAKKYPDLCRLESEDRKIGCQSYVIDKPRLSIRLTAPYSEERRKAARERAWNRMERSADSLRLGKIDKGRPEGDQNNKEAVYNDSE